MKRLLAFALFLLAAAPLRALTPDGRTSIVLIAGSKSHGPGMHEYLKSARLLAVLLQRSPSLHNISTTVIYDGWPKESDSVLDHADTIVYLSDGMQWSPWTFTPARVAAIQKQIDRGCGFMVFHFAAYIPAKFHDQGMSWLGGYIEYDGPRFPASKYPNGQYFTQKVLQSDVVFPTPSHPVMNGVHPFHVHDEFYYRGTFQPTGVTPLLRIPELPADPKIFPGPLATPADQVVMWAYDRPRQRHQKIAGRSIGATFGHFYTNWQNDDYRTLILNAIAWSAHCNIPPTGIASTWLPDEEIDRALGPTPAPVKDPLEPAK